MPMKKKRRASFSPVFVKNHVFWIKLKPPCSIECKRETFGDYYRAKRQQKQTVKYAIKEENDKMEIPEEQYGVAMDYVLRDSGSDTPQRGTGSGTNSGDEEDDEDSNEPGIRLLFHFTVKKYVSFIIFLTVMIVSWSVVLTNMVYNKYVAETPDREYVKIHNLIRLDAQEKHQVTNMLRLVTSEVDENTIALSLTCSNYNETDYSSNLHVSEDPLKWEDVILSWVNDYKISSLSYRRIIWHSARYVGCNSMQCIVNKTILHIYKCTYTYIPMTFGNLSLLPYEKGIINDKCRNKYDHETNLCINSCENFDTSELCAINSQEYCEKFTAFRSSCLGSCTCPKGTIFYTPMESNTYVGIINELRKYAANNSEEHKKLPSLELDKELESKALFTLKMCPSDLKQFWYYETFELVRFRALADLWIKEFKNWIEKKNVTNPRVYGIMLKPNINSVGCSFYYCDKFVYLCLFVV